MSASCERALVAAVARSECPQRPFTSALMPVSRPYFRTMLRYTEAGSSARSSVPVRLLVTGRNTGAAVSAAWPASERQERAASIEDGERLQGFNTRMEKRLGQSTMKFKAIATAAVILSFTSAGIFAADSPTPIPSGAIPAVAATATPAAPTTAAELKPVKKRFLLSHSSSVYEQPDKTSAVIGHALRRP
jgi:hypothetical protein